MISKDIQITNEVYSVQGVEFDRQVIFCNTHDQVAADMRLLTLSQHQLWVKHTSNISNQDFSKGEFSVNRIE